MARSKKKAPAGRRARSWLDRRNLLLLETVLLVGLTKEILEDLVLGWDRLHPLLRILLGIAVVVGTLGGLLVMFEQQIRRGLERTHQVVQRLPVPTPELLVHLLVLTAIFWTYAWFWDDRTGALASGWALLASALAWLRG